MNPAALRNFFEAHDFAITPGSVSSFLDDVPDTPKAIAARVVDMSPGLLVHVTVGVLNLASVPSPVLFVTQAGALLLVQVRANGRLRIVDDTGAVSGAMTEETFVRRHAPACAVVHTGLPVERLTGRALIGGFMGARRGTLGRALVSALLSSVVALMMPIGALLVIDKVLGQNGVGTLDVIVLIIVLAEVLRFLTALARDRLLQGVSNDFEHELLAGLFHRILWTTDNRDSLPAHAAFFVARSAGRLRSIFENYSVSLVSDLLLIVILAAVMFALSPVLAAVALTGLVVAFVVIGLHSRARGRALLANKTVEDARNKLFSDFLGKIPDFTAMGRKNLLWASWSQIHNRVAQFQQTEGRVSKAGGALNDLLLNLLRAMLLWFGALEVLGQNLTLGQFVAFNLISVLMLQPVRNVSNLIESMSELRDASEVATSVLNRAKEAARPQTQRLLPPGAGDITAADLTLRIGERVLVRDVTLTIGAGEKVAILGATGTGKSTFLETVLGLRAPDRGQLLYHGIDIQKASLTDYRRRFGVIRQSPSLLPVSIHDNLIMGNDRIPDAEIWRALEAANAANVVEALPDRLATDLKEVAEKLSRGEFQRLCLARTLLSARDGLILDEPTSALDQATERRIGDALLSGEFAPTVVIATHSFELARRFDRVLWLQDGGMSELEGAELTRGLLLAEGMGGGAAQGLKGAEP